jgi:DNA repair protein RadC
MSGLHDGHRQRLKKRFLECGLRDFEEHEVLELALFYTQPRVNTGHRGTVLRVLPKTKK